MGNRCGKDVQKQVASSGTNEKPVENIPLDDVVQNPTILQINKSNEDIISNTVCFGAGCYWGTEKFFKTEFKSQIVRGMVGFMGPETAKVNPTYEEVCNGNTGYQEVFLIEFTGGSDTLLNLARFFFQFHDPTTKDRQGNDRGTQYASSIWCYDDKQIEIAQKVKSELQQLITLGILNCFVDPIVTTEIKRSNTFYPAHAAHQEYLFKNPKGYCNHKLRFAQWPSIVEEEES